MIREERRRRRRKTKVEKEEEEEEVRLVALIPDSCGVVFGQ